MEARNLEPWKRKDTYFFNLSLFGLDAGKRWAKSFKPVGLGLLGLV